MKRLLLMRHAKTENWYQGTDDEGRALVARGWSDARVMSDALVARDWVPDRVLVSTARRTRETWSAMSEAMPSVTHYVLEELYMTSHDRLLDLAMHTLDEVQSLLIIGHNPSIHDLAENLAAGHTGRDYESYKALEAKMPTCAVALFEEDSPGVPLNLALRLVEFLTAKSLSN